MNNLKILYITNGFPPHRWAGTETYTASIASEIKNLGLSVQVLCCGKWKKGPNHWNGYVDDFYNTIPVRRINLNWKKASNPARYLYDNPVISPYLGGYLDEIQPDLVHVTSCETLSASIIGVVKQKRIPLVLSLTDFWFLCPRINLLRYDDENCDGKTTSRECLRCLAYNQKIYRWPRKVMPEKGVELFLTAASKIPVISKQRGFRGFVRDVSVRRKYLRAMFSLPDVRLTASKFVKSVHINNSFDDPIDIHPYGHDHSWLKDYKGKLSSQKIRIGFIGQIIPSKGVHLLLEAAIRMKSQSKERICFSIYGNLQKKPDYGSQLQELANKAQNVQFCGTYPHEESARVFSQIDVLVVPSLWYDFPLIIYEAFATKTPVIATNLGGMAEAITHEVNGLLFERGNVQDLAKQIERLVEAPMLLKVLSEGSPKVRSVQEEGIELLNIYQDLINSRNTGEKIR